MPSLKTLKIPTIPRLSLCPWALSCSPAGLVCPAQSDPQTPFPTCRPAFPHFPVSSASGSFGTPAPGFSSMLYGMKFANLAYVTKTRVRFFRLDRWADVWLPEKRRMKLGSDISKHHKSLLAKIFYDRCVCV